MTRPSVLATALTLVLGTGLLAIAPAASQALPAGSAATVVVGSPAVADDGPTNEFYSAPPADLLGRSSAAPDAVARPKPPATKGTITGQVVGPNGTPLRKALVTGVRFSDLGLPVDLSEEKRVLARTDGSGRFTLKQLREPYLVRICSESVSSGGGGHKDVRSGECDQESSKRFTPSYLGPDGNLNSWMRHTQMFKPVGHRSLGRIVVQPPAVVTGTYKDGANRRVYLTRVDGSIAATTISDDKGQYRFEVAPGPYRVEADRDEGLRTDSTVPGYQSRRFTLRAGRTVRDTFRTRHAGIIRGLVTSNGTPLPEQFLAVLDQDGNFAAGVVTNEIGRYVISSLEPGSYTVTTSYASSAYVPRAQAVQVAQKTVATADLALVPGSRISFQVNDATFPGANGSVDTELRNTEGRVVKAFQGSTAGLPGQRIVFSGLPAGGYTLYVRRSAVPSDGPEQVDFPWQVVTRNVNGTDPDDLLTPVSLDLATVNLVGTLPKGSQLKLTAVPEDSWLRAAHVDGDQATPMAVNWTEQESGGQYVVRGIVPGAYAAAVTTARKERADKPSKTGGNVATTHSTVIVDGPTPTIAFTAPQGAVIRGEFRYATNNRPAIAPFGYAVTDSGAQSWLFPAVSEKQKFGRGFKVERLHAGQVSGRLLDLVGLYEEHPDVLIPDSLVSSARAEPGTSYWFTAGRQRPTVKEGETLDIGVVKLKLHGVIGVRFNIGNRE